jgi:hypothetical protein
MSQNYTTYFIAVTALIIYTGYIISVQGVAGLLLSVAIGLIAAAFLDSVEYLTAIVILTGLAYTMYVKKTQVVVVAKKEGFVSSEPKFGGQNTSRDARLRKYKVGEGEGTGSEIVARVVAMDPPRKARAVSPVLSAGCEGFEDISTGSTDTPPPTSEGSSVPASTASVTKPKQTDQDAAAVVSANATPANSVATTGVQPVADPSAASNAGTPAGSAGLASAAMTPPTVAGFQGQKSTGLFKLGEMPSEQKGGPFVDVASTMNKAVGSLNTDQMAAMTAESKSLMETQKNLMNMLQSMKPVLNDGRQLLDTFSGIFGGLNGVMGK